MNAVAAAVSKPFDEGLAFEREQFLELVQTPESRALRHAFFAERAAAKIPDLAQGTKARTIARMAVVGAGTMGGGIAMNFLSAGIPVTLVEADEKALAKGVAAIRRNYESSQKKGKLSAEALEANMSRLTPTLAFADIAPADLVIEAVFEDMAVKERVFRQLDEIAREGAILATNTSTLDVDRIAAVTRRPQDVLGTHFFSPANVMKLLEIVRGKKTSGDVLATMMQVAKKIGKTAVVSGVCDGFIGNRMLEQYIRQAMFLLEEGASPSQVDRAMEKFGMAMGPFRMSDLAGNDIGWHIRKRRYVEKPDVVYSRIADRLCELGRFGQKTGAGWYRYATGARDAIPDPAVDQLIADYRREIGIAPRKIDDDEIVDRCILALVNEGARILEEGIALRASDIDIVYLTGYGFPRFRGGPMFYADTVGLYRVVRRMHDLPRIRTPTRVSGNRRRWSRGSRKPARRSTVDLSPRPSIMRDAVIVSTARTGLAKSWRGAFNMTHGATLGGHVVRHALARAHLDPAEVDDVVMGCAFPEGATGSNIARQIALRAGLPVTVAGMTVNRFCSSGLQTIAMAAQRIIAGEGDAFVAGGVESISCVQNESNRHMLREVWLAEHKPAIYWPMLETAEYVAKRYAISRERQDEYGARSQQRAAAAAAAGRFEDEIVPMTTTMGVADKESGSCSRKK